MEPKCNSFTIDRNRVKSISNRKNYLKLLKFIKEEFLIKQNIIKARPEEFNRLSNQLIKKGQELELIKFETNKTALDSFASFLDSNKTTNRLERINFIENLLKKNINEHADIIDFLNNIKIDERTAKAILKRIFRTEKSYKIDEWKSKKSNFFTKNTDNFNFWVEILNQLTFDKLKNEDKEALNKQFQEKCELLFKENKANIGNYKYDEFLLEILEQIFNYEKFSKKDDSGFGEKGARYNAYSLAKALNVNVCPYCNRNYTKTVITKTGTTDEKHIARPDFDHFLEKSKHPLLRLSFWNLIPSCKICNSTMKHSKETTIENNIHPYISGFTKDVKFQSVIEGIDDYSVELLITTDDDKKRKQIKNNIDLFRLNEVYNTHSDIVNEIMWKKNIYTQEYFNELEDLFDTKEEFYRYAFGNFIKDEDLGKRPFSKLTKDLYEENDTDISIWDLKKFIFDDE